MAQIETGLNAEAVEARGVSKQFGSVVALDNVWLKISRGEFFSLLGPSGCGKTTLLRVIGGLEEPSSGDVLINSKSVLGQPPYLRSTNMIFQHLALFPHMTVFENIAFGLRMKKVSKTEILRRVNEALALVQLENFGNRQIHQLSGGQQQRVAMARGLVNEPSVLLLDEPLGALDLQLRLQMQVELRRLHRSLQATFIFVTHDQGEAMVMSNRVAVMKAGRVLQVGRPEEIYEHPKNRFVATFIGYTNLLDGHIVEQSSKDRYLFDCGGVRFFCRSETTLAIPSEVTLSLRYEKIKVQPNPDSRVHPSVCKGEIVEKIYMGSITRLVIRLQPELTITTELAASERDVSFSERDTVGLWWPEESAIVLPE